MYLSAFAAPYHAAFTVHRCYGLDLFLAGLIWCFGLQPVWWATFVYWIALVYWRQEKWSRAATYGLLATGLAGTWILNQPDALGAPAYQLWIGAMSVLGFGALGMAARHRRSQAS
jgi:hypothetical protein